MTRVNQRRDRRVWTADVKALQPSAHASFHPPIHIPALLQPRPLRGGGPGCRLRSSWPGSRRRSPRAESRGEPPRSPRGGELPRSGEPPRGEEPPLPRSGEPPRGGEPPQRHPTARGDRRRGRSSYPRPPPGESSGLRWGGLLSRSGGLRLKLRPRRIGLRIGLRLRLRSRDGRSRLLRAARPSGGGPLSPLSPLSLSRRSA